MKYFAAFKVNFLKKIYSNPVLLNTKKKIIWTGQGFGHYRKVFMIASELDLNFFVSISNNVSTISEWFCRDAICSGVNLLGLGTLGFVT